VFPVGQEYYVMDGHHRWAAYRTAGWKRAIPAKVFAGTLTKATRTALRNNSRNKLPLTKRDRLSAAWRLVKEEDTEDSIASIAEHSGVSTGTVSNMRAVLAKLKGMSDEIVEKIAGMSWNVARRMAEGDDEEMPEVEDWREAEAIKLVGDFDRYNLSGRIKKHPDITALALAMISEELPEALIGEWKPDYSEIYAPETDDMEL
jgi:ParB-like chromosome segregation protein Spo0J